MSVKNIKLQQIGDMRVVKKTLEVKLNICIALSRIKSSKVEDIFEFVCWRFS